MLIKADKDLALVALADCGLDNFTVAGIEEILSYYPEDEVFNPIEIGTSWSEYGDLDEYQKVFYGWNPNIFSWDDFRHDYKHLIDYGEELTDYELAMRAQEECKEVVLIAWTGNVLVHE